MNGFQYKGSIVRNNLWLDLNVLTNSTLLIVTENVCFYFNEKKHGNHLDWPCL
jgi:hypothetical protein